MDYREALERLNLQCDGCKDELLWKCLQAVEDCLEMGLNGEDY